MTPRFRSSFSRVAPTALVGLVAACGGGSVQEHGVSCPETKPTAAPVAEIPKPKLTLHGDEGMWLLNDFPSDRVKELHGFAPDKAWLDHVRLAAVRLTVGCSGSFVSPSGLVMTNHHCAHECIQQLSTKTKDFVASGFYAKAEKDEVKCPGAEIDDLVEITNVSAAMNAATKGLTDKAFSDAQRSAKNQLEKDCAKDASVRCDVVSLYHGGRYDLYKYKRYQDVRLVFAPELAIAFFGGDPDNFNFPRYDLDVSFLRVYENDHPAKIDNYFKWSANGAKAGDLTFVAGHPGGTSRGLTIAQLEFKRDVFLPDHLAELSESRGILTEYATTGAEQARVSGDDLFGIENSIKAYKGEHGALTDGTFFSDLASEEKQLRTYVASRPDFAPIAGAWDAIAKDRQALRIIRPAFNMLEQGGFDSDLFSYARLILRAGVEAKKPNGERLREYSESQLPALMSDLLSDKPLYDDYEILKLTHTLTKLREVLGADDPIVKKVLGQRSPAELANELVKKSKLKDAKVRKALVDGGTDAVDKSTDPMIAFAKLIDDDARTIRKRYEEEVQAVDDKDGELIAKARFDVYGTTTYPDATFTLRLAFGRVDGWDEGGKPVPPFTTIGGAFARATGRDPFALPKSWIDAKGKLDMNVPFDMSLTNDVVGGNSGSPVLNKDAEIVGLIFDGNIHSLGGDYGYDAALNRSVAVTSVALTHALDKVYGAGRILAELKH